MQYISYLLQFGFIFIISYLYYRLIAFKGLSKKKIKSRNKELPEVKLFILLNKLDMKKISYLKLANKLAILISLSLALTVVLTFNVSKNIFARIAICVLSLIITMFISYKLLGFYYKKKGLVKDVQS